MKNYKYILGSLLVFTVCCLISCKKYFDPPLVFEKEEAQTITKDRKVLLISIDGLAGTELNNYVPTNMTKLLEHSKYTFESIADANTKDAATWTTMLSGKSSNKHGVYSNDFDASDEDDDDIHDHEGSGVSTGYISLYQRLLESGRNLKTLSVTPWQPLDHNLFNLSDENGVAPSDEAAKTKAIDRIKNGEKDLAFAVVNFRDLNTAGQTGGFSMDNPNYKATLDRIDGYVGDIIAAVEQRKNYAGEDWLIIITANHGGVDKGYGGATLQERKVPLIFYSKNFTKVQIELPQIVNTLTVKKAGNDIPIMKADPNAYEVGKSGEFTIISKVKVSAFPTTNSVLYGKTSHAYSGTKGWHLMVEGSGKRFRYIMGNGTLIYIYAPGPLTMDQWHNVALKIYNEGDKRMAVCYMDGVPGAPVDITGKDLTAGSANPFFIGAGPAGKSYGVATAIISNLAFYDTGLSETEINAFKCKEDIPPTDANYANLKGFWRVDEGAGKELKNTVQTSTNTSFLADGALEWSVQSKWNCFNDDELKEEAKKKILYQQDIASQIFYWLHIKPADSWGLEGKVFLSDYETEFVGK